jgi:DNA-binding LacI/PurR family transcriptional regulator
MHVAHELSERISVGDVAVGEKLPPMKKLATEFNVSVVTAFRAVQLMADDGLVATRGGRDGTVVIRSEPLRTVADTAIACLLRPPRARNHEDDFALDMIQGVREAISQHDCILLYHGLDEERYEQRMSQLLDADQVCACLLDQKTPLSVIRRLATFDTPAVLLNRHEDVPGLCTVAPDYERIGRDTVRFLLEQGYERLGFYKMPLHEAGFGEIEAATHYPVLALRRGFLIEARAQGLAEADIELIAEPADGRLAALPETYGLPSVRPADWRRLGILAATDANAVDLMRALVKTDLKLAGDVGIVGCYDLGIGRRAPAPPSTWRIDRAAIGRRAVRELLAQINAPDGGATVNLQATFLDRGTA